VEEKNCVKCCHSYLKGGEYWCDESGQNFRTSDDPCEKWEENNRANIVKKKSQKLALDGLHKNGRVL
jgi:hypothetical protein